MELKRDLVKYVRDKAKSQYKKTSSCYICGSNADLDFHHYYGLTELLETWIKQNNNIPFCVETGRVISNKQKQLLTCQLAFWGGGIV